MVSVYAAPSAGFEAVASRAPRQGWAMQHVSGSARFNAGKGLRGEAVVVARYRGAGKARAACEKERLLRVGGGGGGGGGKDFIISGMSSTAPPLLAAAASLGMLPWP